MASIRTRVRGGRKTYEVRWREGHLHRSTTVSRMEDARRLKTEKERRQQLGELYTAAPDSYGAAVADFLTRYQVGLESRRKPRPASVDTMRLNLAPLRRLAGLRIDLVSLTDLENVAADVARDHPRRAELTLAAGKRVLRSARRRGQPINAGALDAHIARADSRDPVFLTWEQTLTLQSWMPEYVSRIVPLAVLTMARLSELLALRDSDVDLAAGAVTVVEQLQQRGRSKAKTPASRRTIDVGPLAVRLLKEQRLARTPSRDGLLFTTRTGLPFDRKRFYGRYFVPASAAAGLGVVTVDEKTGGKHYEGLTFHDLRHTGASLMIAAGCNVKAIAEQMGHADGGVLVLKRYGHLYKGHRAAAASALEAYVLSAGAGPARAGEAHA